MPRDGSHTRRSKWLLTALVPDPAHRLVKAVVVDAAPLGRVLPSLNALPDLRVHPIHPAQGPLPSAALPAVRGRELPGAHRVVVPLAVDPSTKKLDGLALLIAPIAPADPEVPPEAVLALHRLVLETKKQSEIKVLEQLVAALLPIQQEDLKKLQINNLKGVTRTQMPNTSLEADIAPVVEEPIQDGSEKVQNNKSRAVEMGKKKTGNRRDRKSDKRTQREEAPKSRKPVPIRNTVRKEPGPTSEQENFLRGYKLFLFGFLSFVFLRKGFFEAK
ncbi:hypothetical protein CAEBREN_06293 [Caenorhabditis brenneri]|uniref:Uncharacterized protein n=1 Tax=Caenorhabditis brenneri TaxID=135651 RepID=G0NZD5_CAEBE|nr:hypothetical protein CAEBREN_06293 [Caenorhabditis brenneri]